MSSYTYLYDVLSCLLFWLFDIANVGHVYAGYINRFQFHNSEDKDEQKKKKNLYDMLTIRQDFQFMK